MIKIKEKELSVAGVKFNLPNEFFIDIEGLEEIQEDGLRFLSPEKDCSICILTSPIEYKSAVDSLMDIFRDDVLFEGIEFDFFKDNETGYKWIEAPQECIINDLKAAYVKYETPCHYYYEINFERLDGYDRQLEVCIYMSKDENDLESVLSRKDVQKFINGFRMDKLVNIC